MVFASVACGFGLAGRRLSPRTVPSDAVQEQVHGAVILSCGYRGATGGQWDDGRAHLSVITSLSYLSHL